MGQLRTDGFRGDVFLPFFGFLPIIAYCLFSAFALFFYFLYPFFMFLFSPSPLYSLSFYIVIHLFILKDNFFLKICDFKFCENL